MDKKKKIQLAVFDIDGTLRRVKDPWLFLHHYLGTYDTGKDYYRQWISGIISYSEMAMLDASLWRGVPKEKIMECLRNNPLRKGAKELIQWLRKKSITCVGISTGLSVFNEITKSEIGLDYIISNDLLFSKGFCQGKVLINVEEDNKIQILYNIIDKYKIDIKNVISFGDGLADIPLLKNTGIGIAIFPTSEEVKNVADYIIENEPIDTVCESLLDLFNEVQNGKKT